ncbi:hypothetical protein ABS755_02115 [Castellaniella sp. FW104-16D08]|uniref:hypothetical protein n=1 Tax=unclassified Castellaniella TaxID=2617606 RepID=UPI0033148DE0
MNTPHSPRRPSAAVFMLSLLWLWLIGLSICVFLGYQAMGELADRERVDSGLHRLEAQVIALADATQTLQQRPQAATPAALQEVRQALEARIAQVEQIEAHQAMVRAVTPAPPSPPPTPTKPVAVKSAPPPLPFRVVGVELRAGERSLTVAPAKGAFTPGQVQALLPGDAVGPWRLQAIDGNIAVFLVDKHTRRVAIP